ERLELGADGLFEVVPEDADALGVLALGRNGDPAREIRKIALRPVVVVGKDARYRRLSCHRSPLGPPATAFDLRGTLEQEEANPKGRGAHGREEPPGVPVPRNKSMCS